MNRKAIRTTDDCLGLLSLTDIETILSFGDIGLPDQQRERLQVSAFEARLAASDPLPRLARLIWIAAGLKPEERAGAAGLRAVIDRIAAAAVQLARGHAAETALQRWDGSLSADFGIEAAAKRAVEGDPA